jgi:hypothetical protein
VNRAAGDGLWRVVGASVAGAGHKRQGLDCQDRHCCREVAEGVVVVVVADGAGSAGCGDFGSTLAAEEAWRSLSARAARPLPETEAEWHGLLRDTLSAARRTIVEGAQGAWEPRDMATTLLVAVATPGLIAAGQVGDGAVVARFGQESFLAVTRPVGQDYVNETMFLTSPGAVEKAQLVVMEGELTGLAAFTDGLQMLALKMPFGMPHKPFFAPLFRLLAAQPPGAQSKGQLEGFLRSPAIAQRADDDLTLVLAVRPPNTDLLS